MLLECAFGHGGATPQRNKLTTGAGMVFFRDLPRFRFAILLAMIDDALPMTPRGREVLRSLTPREREALALTCAGHTIRQIAERMGIAEPTVKRFLSTVY